GDIEYVRTFSSVGYARVTIPPDDPVAAKVRPDWRLHIYRQPAGGTLSLEIVCFLRRFVWETDEQGRRQLVLQGKGPNDLLNRRIIDRYAETSGSAAESLEADRAMLQVFDYTLGALADFDHDNIARSWARDLVDAGVIRRQNNITDGPIVDKKYAWKNALKVLQDLQAQARQKGNEVFFGIVPVSPTMLEFRTWTGQPGVDRSVGSGTSPIVFSLAGGTLANPSLEYDYSNSRNFIFAGGQGIDDDRKISEAFDEERIGLSVFGRSEAFVQASRYSTSDGVAGVAEDEVARKRPAVILTGELPDTPLTPYGGPDGWNLGDRVTLSYQGFQFDTLVRSVHVRVNPQGRERIRGRIEADASLIAG
ncbi:MAG: Gp37-like protein, partial [Chloroflexota bacterium]